MERGRTRRLSPGRGLVLVAVPLAAALAAVAACQTSEPGQAGAGAECFVASDCAEGLACVPQRNGGRRCSNDLSQVTGDPPAQGEAGAEGGADATADGPAADATDDAPGNDAGGNDAGMDAGTDSGDAAAD